ncbi:MAG: sigma factor-like helix-turn-helix DNA-binding protein [Tepidisphaeraceae bacterium]|jgi:DNA-binding CsgD family transcriptional regulator
MSRRRSKPAAEPPRLTVRQQEVLAMRYDLGATIEQIAVWLTISPRAVSYRLRTAHRRLRGRTWADYAKAEKKGRTYSVSQISAATRCEPQNLGEI